ncbi:MAG: SHOCT domain-containing protein [Actinomycetota bacterium]
MLTPTLAFVARGGPGGPGPLMFLLFIALIGGLAYWLIRRRRGDSVESRSALEALRERFARGEIDRAEFEHRKAVLIGAEVVPPPSGTTATPGPAASQDPTGPLPTDE